MTESITRRVLHLRSSGGMLGAERVILSLCAHARDFGYDPFLAVIQDSTDAESELISVAAGQGVPAFSIACRNRFDLGATARVRDLVRSLDIDVLHCHGYREDFYAVLSRAGVKLVTTNHLWKRSTAALRLYAKIDGYLMRRFDSVVAVSRDILEELSNLGIQESRLAYIPNGVDARIFDAFSVEGLDKGERKSALGIDERHVVLTTTGSLTEEKGHRLMLDALAESSLLDAQITWLVVGDGERAEHLQQRAAELGLGSRVRFLGRREDVAELLRVTDIFVLPSLLEGLPIALLEAMAAGRACIATRVGDVAEVIDSGVTGLIVEPGSSSALVRAVELLVGDSALRERLGRAARRAIDERYTSQRMTESYCALYDRLFA